VQISTSDRDYMIDLGFVTGEEWVNIARSATVHVFNPPYTDPLLASLPGLDPASSVVFSPRSPKWAYVSWDISPAHQQLLKEHGITQLALRLYDATNIDLSYQHSQLVQHYEFDEITSDLYVSIPQSDRDYLTEVGYVTTGGDWVTVARSATTRIYNNAQGDFWFVADSELIIHGATDPDATVTIAGKPIALKPDGTFHLRVPFSGDLLDYLITVAHGEQRKTIHKKFTQETTES
jgi:phosphate transport system substrate-binding protein